ncbi:MAG: MBL fold metallo-hydrolase [Clostridia bacterium]|nr:MBL fold metallo-hydrolase [Clostridia bacterium]
MPAFTKLTGDVFFLKVPFGPVDTCPVLIDGAEKVLIDSGPGEKETDEILIPALRERGIGPKDLTLLCTHTHGDHVGGHARLRELGAGRILCIEASAPKLTDPLPYATATRSRFPEHSPKPGTGLKPVHPDAVLRDGDLVAGRLRLIATPGHDDDSVCWLDEETGVLITGDSIQGNGTICQGIGFYKSLPAYRSTLEKLETFHASAILCGHDYDGIGLYVSGKKEVERALQYCRERVDVYKRFVIEHQAEDPADIAKALIEKEGCGMPPMLFMALYTVTEHLKELNNG